MYRMFFRWKDSIFEVTRKFSFLIQVCNVKEEEKCTAELNQAHFQNQIYRNPKQKKLLDDNNLMRDNDLK